LLLFIILTWQIGFAFVDCIIFLSVVCFSKKQEGESAQMTRPQIGQDGEETSNRNPNPGAGLNFAKACPVATAGI
jgi:hypothetical protein